MMESSLEFTKDKHPIKVSYPFLPQAALQKPNLQQIMAVQRAHESRTIKLGVAETYKAEIDKYKEIGTIVRVWPEELATYQ